MYKNEKNKHKTGFAQKVEKERESVVEYENKYFFRKIIF